VVENGYLDPLRELGYGTGSGFYLGQVEGEQLSPGVLMDGDARQAIRRMIDRGLLHGDNNSLFMLILPAGVTARFDNGESSCEVFCGYHDALTYEGVDIAYAILPSSQCSGCGNGNLGAFTALYSHELAEACTDKVPGKGWVADDGQENG